MAKGTCSFPDCGNVLDAAGLCRSHYSQKRLGKPLAPLRKYVKGATCDFPGCGRPRMGQGLCNTHYLQQYRGKPLTEIKPRPRKQTVKRVCEFPDCGRPYKARGLCSQHSRQSFRGELKPIRVKDGPARIITAEGYVKVWAPDHPNAQSRGWIFEHVKVMSDLLGRPLLPGENAHHKNGCKDDNRLSNLELWARSQPSGQRAKDLLVWAREIVARYGPEEDKL